MSKKLYEEADIQAVANAIRLKNGSTSKYKLSEMADEITAIPVDELTNALKGLIEGSIAKLVITDGTESIATYAFYCCDSLASITIPDSVINIGSYAFYSCSKLKTVTLGNGVTDIGFRAFYSCESLTSITIPDSVISIGSYAFSSCFKLTKVTLGNGVTDIDTNTFYSCTSLTNVTLNNGFNASGLDLSVSTKYTRETIVSWLNALADRTGQTAYRLTIGSTNLAKLTSEDKAIATNKNWTLA